MQKLNDLNRCLTPLERDGTLIAIIEMSQGRPENRRHERRAGHQVARQQSAPIMNAMPLEWAPGEAAALHR